MLYKNDLVITRKMNLNNILFINLRHFGNTICDFQAKNNISISIK